MNWYTINYLRETEEVRDELDAAEWRLIVNGFSRESVTGALEMKRRQQYLDFIYRDTSGLGAQEFLYFFPSGYKVDCLVLTDYEVQGILGARGSHSPWELRRTQCVSDETSNIIEFFLGKDVSEICFCVLTTFTGFHRGNCRTKYMCSEGF